MDVSLRLAPRIRYSPKAEHGCGLGRRPGSWGRRSEVEAQCSDSTVISDVDIPVLCALICYGTPSLRLAGGSQDNLAQCVARVPAPGN
jgi:hypothetical protein